MSELVLGLALIATVLTLAALASGVVERAPLSFPIIFLGLGFLLGPSGLGLITLGLHSPLLEVIAIVSLALVLFLDAVKMQLDEIRQNWLIPFLSLGPGTLLTIAGVAVTAYFIAGTTPVHSLLLGAILASTDPVVLRDVLRDPRIPRSVRQALGVEAGMNDIVVLPIVLILIAVLTARVGGALEWAAFLARLLLLSPVVGLAVGGIGAWLMGKADKRFGIREVYQALYGIGLVLAAYAAGQLVHGDGFLAAFFAGLAVTLFNVSICECFLEYGEVTSEMAMLFAFMLFGAVLSTLVGSIAMAPVLVLAFIAICVVRPAAVWLVLQRARMSNIARAFIGWFGPRGLNSLLLALLVVQANAPGAEMLFTIAGTVVLVSVVLHGVTATPFSNWYGRRVTETPAVLAEEREGTAVGLFKDDPLFGCLPTGVHTITAVLIPQRANTDNTPAIKRAIKTAIINATTNNAFHDPGPAEKARRVGRCSSSDAQARAERPPCSNRVMSTKRTADTSGHPRATSTCTTSSRLLPLCICSTTSRNVVRSDNWTCVMALPPPFRCFYWSSGLRVW
ncbi:MAG: sodium:proton antiporter [Chloroflexi bacterium]|nr:sodium:proton antiporter [Chloroflexota bacterium]